MLKHKQLGVGHPEQFKYILKYINLDTFNNSKSNKKLCSWDLPNHLIWLVKIVTKSVNSKKTFKKIITQEWKNSHFVNLWQGAVLLNKIQGVRQYIKIL